MKTIRTEIMTFMNESFCECGGIYKFSGMILTSIPPQYPHKCDRCGNIENLAESYPQIQHEIKSHLDRAMKIQALKSNSPEKPDGCEQVGISE